MSELPASQPDKGMERSSQPGDDLLFSADNGRRLWSPPVWHGPLHGDGMKRQRLQDQRMKSQTVECGCTPPFASQSLPKNRIDQGSTATPAITVPASAKAPRTLIGMGGSSQGAQLPGR